MTRAAAAAAAMLVAVAVAVGGGLAAWAAPARAAPARAASAGGARSNAGADAPEAQVISRLELDGVDDDLLTAGLGLEGLQRSAPPGLADPLQPTPRELRRRAIWTSWRGLIDLSADGGVGRLFGPRPGERIAGVEILGAIAPPTSASATVSVARRVDAVLLQVPRGFDPDDACVVVVASSGSRGIFGALPTAAEWGLRQGCAVITSDKGTGSGFFDTDRGGALRLDGVATTNLADPFATFVPAGTSGTPALRHRVLSKHAHSGVDPEPRWGERLLLATRVGFAWLNAEYRARLRQPLGPANTRVIASGISNGGAVVLRALELDRGSPRERWFDAAVVAEPNAIVARAAGVLRLGRAGRGRSVAVRSLLDYATLAGLLQPCALLDAAESAAPLAPATPAARAVHEDWCADLARHGEVDGADVAARAHDARARLLAAGFEPDSLQLGPLNHQAQLWPSIAVTYLQAHAGARLDEAPCGLGFAAVGTDGEPRALDDAAWARLAADGTGIPPTAGIAIVRDDGAPVATAATMRCLRAAVESALQGSAASVAGTAADFTARLRDGLEAIQMRADPGARPVIVLHGRDDGLIAVNHSSRAWYAAALRREPRAELRYYELPRVQHFDAFLSLPGFAGRYQPMQPYLLAAMARMDARLRRGTALPGSQVLRPRARATTPSGAVVPLAASDLGGFVARPGRAARIVLRADGVLAVPD